MGNYVTYYDYNPNFSDNDSGFDITDSFLGYASKVKQAILTLNISFFIDVIFIPDSKFLIDKKERGVFSELWNKFCNNKIERKPCIIVSSNPHSDIQYTLFDDTNIWIKYVNFKEPQKEISKQIEAAIEYFLQCNILKLYNQESAREYIDYHLRIQKENQLNEGHRNIFPNRYASEAFYDKEIKRQREKQEEWKKSGIEEIGIRLLLVDDKIPCLEREKRLKLCDQDGANCEGCKLVIVKKLLTKDEKFRGFNSIWDTANVKAYTIGDKKDIIKINEEIHSADKVQIIGVNSIEFARRIIADNSLKFDLVLLDYYFHRNSKEDYGTELLRFIEQDQTREYVQKQRSKILEKLRQNMRQNVGLENKFWIFPITAFPSSFQTHAQSSGVPFLTSDWYMYTPTNPIVMPKRFLYNLNEFIGLMINRSVYTEENLINFFTKTCDGCVLEWGKYKSINNSKEIIRFYVSFMGSEYRRFIQLYDARLNIARDKDVSLFAKSIWDNFYEKTGCTDEEKTEMAKLLTLNFFMRKFFYASTYLTNDRNGREKLQSAWIDLQGCLKNSLENGEKNDGFNTFCKEFPQIMEKMINKQ